MPQQDEAPLLEARRALRAGDGQGGGRSDGRLRRRLRCTMSDGEGETTCQRASHEGNHRQKGYHE